MATDPNGASEAFTLVIPIQKVDDDQQMVWGWASVSKDGGQTITDWQGDQIDIGELQKAAHEYMGSSRIGGEMHDTMGVSHTVDSIVFTPEVQKALGIDLGRTGWFIGQKITNPSTWADVKKGKLKSFSIGGTGTRKAVEG